MAEPAAEFESINGRGPCSNRSLAMKIHADGTVNLHSFGSEFNPSYIPTALLRHQVTLGTSQPQSSSMQAPTPMMIYAIGCITKKLQNG
ncbi:hypothetical protein AB1N83_009683 [Pleurotus pulmonarius]